MKKDNPVASFFMPIYNEISLYLMGFAFICLFIIDKDLVAECSANFSKYDPREYIFIAIFFSGIIFSLYHVFTSRQKNEFEKYVMIFFAVIINAYSGIQSGKHELDACNGIMIIFPLWNIVNGLILFMMFKWKLIDEKNIADDNASPLQVFFGSVVIVVIIYLCEYCWKVYWATTFSICVAYASNVAGLIQKYTQTTGVKEISQNHYQESNLKVFLNKKKSPRHK